MPKKQTKKSIGLFLHPCYEMCASQRVGVFGIGAFADLDAGKLLAVIAGKNIYKVKGESEDSGAERT